MWLGREQLQRDGRLKDKMVGGEVTPRAISMFLTLKNLNHTQGALISWGGG